MYDQQQVFSDSLYLIVYGGAMILALIGCIYLLFRRSNAFAPEVTPPLRLRRWVAAFFVVMLLSHISWYVFVKYGFFGDSLTGLIVAAALDCMVLIPLIMGMLQAMLQDRRRPLWPFFLATLPVAAFFVVIAYRHDTVLVPWVQGYFMLMTVIMFIYMAFAVRQYSLWLRNNYADLENKEVWQSFMVLAICLLVLSFYVYYSSNGMTYEYAVQVFDYLFIAILLWRVETLQTLENNDDNDDIIEATGLEEVMALQSSAPQVTIPDNIGQLLEHYCEGRQLYLRQDITLSQLSKAIGTNRYYLSQYFTRQDTTYNAYINSLRIQHFVRLYQEASAAKRSFTAQQLAQECGFRSYSTFAVAFKQRMGQTVSTWMRNTAK